jgi:hypothetical protein
MPYILVEIYQVFGIFSQHRSDYLAEFKTFGIEDYEVYMVQHLFKHKLRTEVGDVWQSGCL